MTSVDVFLFPDYYNDPEKGSSCVGQRVGSIYVGDYDRTAIKPGMEVEIYYDKAVPTKEAPQVAS